MINTVTFSVCLSSGVTLRGVAGSMFPADYNRGSKFIRSELMNTQGRGILSQLSEKNLHLLLPRLMGDSGLWLAIPAAELLTCIVICTRYAVRNLR